MCMPRLQLLRPCLVIVCCVGLGACGGGQVRVADPSANSGGTPRAAEEPELSRPLGECPGHADGISPILWSESTADDRWGQGVSEVTLVRSSQAVPIEVCGVLGQLMWLTNLVCANGQPPFQSARDAHASRQGSVGGGGRCGAIIDLYSVPCPERNYEVYLDMYQCGPDESFR